MLPGALPGEGAVLGAGGCTDRLMRLILAVQHLTACVSWAGFHLSFTLLKGHNSSLSLLRYSYMRTVLVALYSYSLFRSYSYEYSTRTAGLQYSINLKFSTQYLYLYSTSCTV